MLRATAKSRRIIGLLVVLAFAGSAAFHTSWLFRLATRHVIDGYVEGCIDHCRYLAGLYRFDPTLILFLLTFYMLAERLLLKGWGRGTPYAGGRDSGGPPN